MHLPTSKADSKDAKTQTDLGTLYAKIISGCREAKLASRFW